LTGGLGAAARIIGDSRALLSDAALSVDATGTPWRHGYDDSLLRVTYGLTNLAEAMSEGFVGRDHPRPDGLDKFVLGDEAIRIFNKVPKDVEALGAELYLAIACSQAAPHHVQCMSCKFEHPGTGQNCHSIGIS
jgi:hypothetical protein